MAPDTVRKASRRILDDHWRPEGYTVPNADVYPHQWLWDSCFHAIAWAALGEHDRAVTELSNVFARQADDGFVPHMTYWLAPDMHADFWGRRHTSSITQPPMYGHAVAALVRYGIDVPRSVIDSAEAGLRFLTERRPFLVHPWESGCDDSPRWDAWCDGDWDPVRWRQVKGELVAGLVLDPVTRSPVGSTRFEVRSAGFDALVAFNAAELADATGRLVEVPPHHGTDDEVRVGPSGSSGVRTADALFGVLDPAADERDRELAFAALRDPAQYGGAFGPAAVHRDEPAFDPDRYWRGPSWPQLTYLLWVAAERSGRIEDAAWMADRLLRGVVASGFAEYWNPDTGAGLGAVPQSWSALAALVDPVATGGG